MRAKHVIFVVVFLYACYKLADTLYPTLDQSVITKSINKDQSVIRDDSHTTFESIYRDAAWSYHEDTLSGPGSMLTATNTTCKVFSSAILRVVEKGRREVSILDAPAGDFWWQYHCLLNLAPRLPRNTRVTYQGVDVSSTAVQRANGRLRGWNVEGIVLKIFMQIDLAKPDTFKDTLKKQRFDVILCNDALMHNPDEYVWRILRNLNAVAHAESYLVTNSFLVDSVNVHMDLSLKPFPFRRLDLTSSPFNLQPFCGDEEFPGEHNPQDWGEFELIYEMPLPIRHGHLPPQSRVFQSCVKGYFPVDINGGGFDESRVLEQYRVCAADGQVCKCNGLVRFGRWMAWVTKQVNESVGCTKEDFGKDPWPFPEFPKHCVCNGHIRGIDFY